MTALVVAAAALVVALGSARVALQVTRAGEVAARLGASSSIAPQVRPSWLRWPSGAQHRRVVRELPDVLEDVARSLRSGTSLRVALAEAAGVEHSRAPADVAVVGGARGDVAVVERVGRSALPGARGGDRGDVGLGERAEGGERLGARRRDLVDGGVAVGGARGDARLVVGGARGDIAVVVQRADRGEPLGAALDAWARSRPLPEVRLVVAALGLGLEAGAASARTVDGLAATLRERSAVAGEVSAQATQARLSALVISALPLAFTTWTCLTDRRIADFLFATPAGWGCLLGGVTLNALGALWMRRITRSVA